MKVRKLKFEASEALLAEMKEIDSWYHNSPISAILPKLNVPEDYFRDELSGGNFSELSSFLAQTKGSLDVLDIGVGRGQSSVYLASQGHRVTALEPSGVACRDLGKVADHFDLPIEVVQGNAESVAQLGAGLFDLVIFNSSLHHCDEPVPALEGCRKVLKDGGTLVLLNEPLLKPFRSKRWYYGRLKTHPQQMGHYGGNEHVYYAWEYKRMLKRAGFGAVRVQASGALQNLRGMVTQMAGARAAGGYVYSEDKLFLHYAWHVFLSKANRFPALGAALRTSSLLPVRFVASKPGEKDA